MEQTVKYLPRISKDPFGDEEARAQMLYVYSMERLFVPRGSTGKATNPNIRRLAASTAGIGFGNAGVHLCVSIRPAHQGTLSLIQTRIQHAASYPISSLNKGRAKELQYHHPSYSPNVPLIPHGVAVSLTAPSVFRFTAPSAPQRHREAAAIFMGDRKGELDRVSDESIGDVLGTEIMRFLDGLGVPRGLAAVGYANGDVGKVGFPRF